MPPSSGEGRSAIASAGGIEALVALLIRQLDLPNLEGDTLCKTNAAGALLNLAQEDAFREAIGAAGGIEALVKLARDGDAEGKSNAAGALGSLACVQANRQSIVAAGAIEALVTLACDGANAQGATNSGGALTNLALD